MVTATVLKPFKMHKPVEINVLYSFILLTPILKEEGSEQMKYFKRS